MQSNYYNNSYLPSVFKKGLLALCLSSSVLGVSATPAIGGVKTNNLE